MTNVEDTVDRLRYHRISMTGPSKKWLSLLLSLALGLTPLQAAFADLAGSPGHLSGMHQMADGHDCEQNTIGEGCADKDCPSCQCIFPVLPPDFSYSMTPAASPDGRSVDDGLIGQNPASLYRPPRG